MENQKIDSKRRGFLLAAGAGSAAAVGAVAITSIPAAQKVAKAAPSKTGAYHESEHIRDYYDSARM
jgi:hypothetical protein